MQESKLEPGLCDTCDQIHLILTIGKDVWSVAIADDEWEQFSVRLAMAQKERDKRFPKEAKRGH